MTLPSDPQTMWRGVFGRSCKDRNDGSVEEMDRGYREQGGVYLLSKKTAP